MNLKCSRRSIRTGSLFLVFLFLCLLLPLASVPPVNRDALTHHLVVTKLYIQHGWIYEIPDIEFSYYPQLMEFLYLIPQYFSNDIIPAYIHLSLGLFAALLIYSYARSKLNKQFSLAIGLFFLSLPIIVKLSTTAYVDLGLYFFTFLSLFFLIHWFRQECFKYLLFSGIACGLAMSCKYNGLITFFCMFFSLLWLASKKDTLTKNVLYSLFLFCFISISVFSPWLIKNYKWTGNPVYPLYKDFFNGPEKQIQASEMKNEKRSHFYYRRVVFEESLAETLSTPVRIFFQGRDDDPKFFDGILNPFLFFMPIIAMIFEIIRYRKKHEPDYERILLFLFSWTYILFVYFQTDMRIRWIGPAIAPLTVLTFLGIHDLWNIRFKNFRAANIFKCGIGVAVALMFFLNFNYIIDLYKKVDPVPYLTGKISRDDYIQKHRPEYAAYQYINANLPKDAKIFGLMMGNRRYYCDREMITDENILRSSINKASSSNDVRNDLAKIGTTHIIMDNNIYSFWSNGVFTEEKKKLMFDFWGHHSRLLFDKYGYSVYEIVR